MFHIRTNNRPPCRARPPHRILVQIETERLAVRTQQNPKVVSRAAAAVDDAQIAPAAGNFVDDRHDVASETVKPEMSGFGESCELEEIPHRSAARWGGAGHSSSIKPPVVVCRSENALHVILSLGKRDVVDEFVLLESGPLGNPACNAVLAGVVAGERVVLAAESIHQILEIAHPEPDIGFRLG